VQLVVTSPVSSPGLGCEAQLLSATVLPSLRVQI